MNAVCISKYYVDSIKKYPPCTFVTAINRDKSCVNFVDVWIMFKNVFLENPKFQNRRQLFSN